MIFHQKSMEIQGLQWVSIVNLGFPLIFDEKSWNRNIFGSEKNKKPFIDKKIFFHINMYLTENSLFKVFASV